MDTEITSKSSLCARTKTSPRPPTSKGFLDLPPEIRRNIYHCLFPPKDVIEVYRLYLNSNRHSPDPKNVFDLKEIHKRKNNISILLLSKTITEEAFDILYGESVFGIVLEDEVGVFLKEAFTEANRRRIKHLRIITPNVNQYNPSIGKIFTGDLLWASILPTLKTLLIIAEPLPGNDPFDCMHWIDYSYASITQINSWVEGVEPFWKCIGQYLSNSKAIVGVAVYSCKDDEVEIKKLARNYLPGSARIKSTSTRYFTIHGGVYGAKYLNYHWETGDWDDYFFDTTSSQSALE